MLIDISTLGTSIYMPSVGTISRRFDVGDEVGLLGFMFFVLGLGCGPIIGSPASETFGRRPVYLITIPLFGLFTVGAGLAQNIETILVCRLFAGLFGGPALAVGAGTSADLYPPERRVFVISLITFGPSFASGVGWVFTETLFCNEYHKANSNSQTRDWCLR